GAVLSWDLASGRQRRSFDGHTVMVRGVAISPNGRWLATASYDNQIQLWEVARHALDRRLVPQGGVYDLAISSSGQQLLAALSDGTLAFWNVESSTVQAIVKAHSSSIRRIACHPDGKLFATAGQDATIKLWRWTERTEVRELRGHAGTVMDITFSPDGKLLASGGIDKTVRLWDSQTGQQEQVLRGHTGGLRRVRFSPDGRTIATGAADKTVRLWNARSGQLIETLTGHSAEVWTLDFSPDGQLLASGDHDNTLRLWNLQDRTSRVLGKGRGRIYEMHFQPGGEWLGVTTDDSFVELWHLKDGRRREFDTGFSGSAFTFSPDGKELATGSMEAPAQLWRTSDGRPEWRAPALLSSPARLLTQQGWLALSDRAAPPLPDALRQVVNEQSRLVRQIDDDRLCLQTWNHQVQLWTRQADQPLQQLDLSKRAQLVALPRSCLVATPKAVHLLTDEGTRKLAVEGEITAVGRCPEGALVASPTHLDVYAPDGSRSNRRNIDVGVVAVGRIGTALAVGYRDGKVEILPDKPGDKPPSVAFERTPASPPQQLMAGPMNTLIVGYRSGDVGIWSLADGSRLAHARLHGPIAHLLLEDDKLFAASELGDHLVWNLSQLRRDYCELMHEVWERVPVVWDKGHAVVRAAPQTHRCHQPRR
ncbi:MAG: hypothetical protein DRI90_19780, partial [Deltaproteobacteria bacterium]